MWPQPNTGGGSGMPPAGVPPMLPAYGSMPTPGSSGGGFDWGVAAQQWLKNKEIYEQWQQQQYQAHLQMMAQAHKAAMTSSIDLTVVNDPPPPPPMPPPDSESDPNSSAPGAKSKFKSRFSNSSLLKAAVAAVQAKEMEASSPVDEHNNTTQDDGSSPGVAKVKPLFPGYQSGVDQAENVAKLETSDLQNLSDNQVGTDKSHKLPSWLRDELEKMKQKKLENANKDTKLNAKQVFNNDDDEDEKEEEDEDNNSGGEEIRSSSRRYRNHSGANEPSRHRDRETTHRTGGSSKSTSKSNQLDLILKKIELNEAEKQEIIVSLVKSWMTELLLEITNLEMQSIAKEVYQYDKDLRSKEELKKTKKSLNITYGEDSDSNASKSDDEPDEETRKRIEQEENAEFLRERGLKKLEEYEARFQAELELQVKKETAVKKSRSRSRSRGGSRRKRSPLRRRSSRSRSRRRSPKNARRRSRSGSRRRGRGRRSSSRSRSRNRRTGRRSRTRTRSRSKERRSGRRRHASSSSSSRSRSPSSSSSDSSGSSSSSSESYTEVSISQSSSSKRKKSSGKKEKRHRSSTSSKKKSRD